MVTEQELLDAANDPVKLQALMELKAKEDAAVNGATPIPVNV